jgi:hypothetical protein
MQNEVVEADAPIVPFPRRRLPKWLVILFGCLVLCSGLYYAIAIQPHYIELDIPPPEGREWHYTQKATQVWPPWNDTYFNWRRETSTYDTGRESIIAYFDEWLADNNWDRIESTTCRVMPEADFLEDGEYHTITYRRPNSEYDLEPSSVCLGVWPIEGGGSDNFNVVLMTEAPSFWTVVWSILTY